MTTLQSSNTTTNKQHTGTKQPSTDMENHVLIEKIVKTPPTPTPEEGEKFVKSHFTPTPEEGKKNC